jgi:hypothetical protein
MDWKCGSDGKVPALQAQILSSKPRPKKKKKKKKKPRKYGPKRGAGDWNRTNRFGIKDLEYTKRNFSFTKTKQINFRVTLVIKVCDM